MQLSKEQNETLNTIKIIKKYYEAHAYKDFSVNITGPYSNYSFVMKKEINKLKEKDFNSTEDFYSSISAIFLKYNDATLRFKKPCDEYFKLVLPYGFTIRPLDINSNQLRVYLTSLPEKYKFVTEKFNKEMSIESLIDFEVITINNTNATEYLSNWAKNNIFGSRNEAIQLNKALKKNFSIRSLSICPFPEFSSYSIELKDISGGKLKFNFPLYGVSEINVSSIESLCPLQTEDYKLRNNKKYKPDNNNKMDNMIKSKNLFLKQNSNNITLLEENEYSSIYKIIVKEKKIGYFRLKTLIFEEKFINNYIDGLISQIKRLKNENIEKLIFDLRGFEGGDASLLIGTLHFFQPNFFPNFPEMGLSIYYCCCYYY